MLEREEEKLDAKMKHLDDMGEDDIERLRQQRLDQMKKLSKQKQEWAANGHGEYREIDDQKRFFDELKTSTRAVVHFYRPSTRRCEIIDKHFYALARKHMETKFVRVNAEKSPFLTERLHVWMLPTIICCVNGRTDHSIVCVLACLSAPLSRRGGGSLTHSRPHMHPLPLSFTLPQRSGFDEMGGDDNFATETLEAILLKHGCLLEAFCN
jgi:hypothetical protein